MRKRLLAAMLAALMLGASALAEVYSGSTVADRSIRIEVEGELAETCVRVGEQVAAGDLLATVETTGVFAAQDGTVASIEVQAGDEVDGTVMEIAPMARYRIYCTVEKAYDSAQSMLVHSGETLYIRCTTDGTHRGIGTVTQIEGSEYQLLTTAGELYVGETVYLYRDSDFSSAQRVGIGTVVGNETQVYEGAGKVSRICVSEGEAVQRGELLYEIWTGSSEEILATQDSIVVSVPSAEDPAFELVPLDALCVELTLDETAAAALEVGDEVALVYAGDPEEQLYPGTVAYIARTSQEGGYVVRIEPQESPQRIGQSVQVHVGS